MNPRPNQAFVDGTFGGGGHGLAILEKVRPNGKVIGIDWDPAVIQDSSNDNLILVNDNYKNLRKIINGAGIDKVDGILLDLGLSSDQLNRDSRGFSFKDQGYLDLRFNPDTGQLTAANILDRASEEELFKIFKDYGEEKLARPIAKEIIKRRERGDKLETVEALVDLVSDIYRRYFRSKSFRHPATKVFQALRIAINDEFGNIEAALPEAVDCLKPGGRLAVISFHSGEDRIVKHFFKKMESLTVTPIRIITKKPVMASVAEVSINPRSRSAKLRVIEKI